MNKILLDKNGVEIKQKTEWYHCLCTLIVCICGIITVSVDVDPNLKTLLIGVSGFILGLLKNKLPKLPPFVVDVLTLGITFLLRHSKAKKYSDSAESTRKKINPCVLLLLIIPIIFMGCSVNPYAENMSEVALRDCKGLIIDRLPGHKPKDFTENEVELYLTGFMRANKISQEDALHVIKILRENGYKLTKEIENIFQSYGIELIE